MEEFPDNVCFASKLLFKWTSVLPAWLHDLTLGLLQKRLQSQGKLLVLLPLKIG
ncbi:hypothetical protein [Paraburkholderia rhizosphaerae]|uniref:Uncharacterized protein n=1 Tax=Paraburkholderia rhizosphaerae TaxID=480658 RepID=A0A4R8LY90_9BURK|nr:hypothetical protein [Paraburkholderia rhizosphaerae]TDY52176.1 hypothetical protein BX592_10560 [Paraburkholderia rhizosphaerae]